MKEQKEVVENLEEKEQKENELLDLDTDSTTENKEPEINVLHIEEGDKEESSEDENLVVEEIQVEEKTPEQSHVELTEGDVEEIIKNNDKNQASNILVKEAQTLVKDADNEMQDCKILLESDLKEYENAKQSLKDNGMLASEEALEKLGISEDEEINKEDAVAFEAENQPNIYIKNISSGKFGSFILSIIAGGATLAGMAFVASQKLGITLDLSNLGSQLERQPITSFYGRLIGLNGDALYGSIFLVAVSLLVMLIVYKIRVSSKATKNLNFATEQLSAAKEYKDKKKSCKYEMDRVDEYIADAIGTLKTYEVILNEQKGKLERILHIEQEKVESLDFHEKSHAIIEETRELINSIRNFISTPLSEEGKLSEKSTNLLKDAKATIEKVVDRLY